MLVEAVDVADCISGDGNAPDPVGATPAECLAKFDYDRDLDFDLGDYANYLTALPRGDPPRLEIGYAVNQPYARIDDGDLVFVFHGFQGGMHMFITFRGVGFAPTGFVFLSRAGFLTETDEVLIPAATFSSVFNEVGLGINEIYNLRVPVALPRDEADGKDAEISFIVTDVNNENITATVTRRVRLVEIE